MEPKDQMVKIGFLQVTNPLYVQWFPPLSFGYLKSYLDRELAGEVDFFRMTTKEEVFHRSIDLLALSTASQDFGERGDLVRRFRKISADCPIILGGHHINYLPETLPRDLSAGVRLEGEVTFAALVRLFQEE